MRYVHFDGKATQYLILVDKGYMNPKRLRTTALRQYQYSITSEKIKRLNYNYFWCS